MPAWPSHEALCLLGVRNAADRVQELDERRPEQDDEHRREDEEDEREEDLDRRLLGALFRACLATAPHLRGEIAHDLADRDAERLTLNDRADERPHRWRIAAGHRVR